MFGGADWAPKFAIRGSEKFPSVSYEATYNSVPGTMRAGLRHRLLIDSQAVKAGDKLSQQGCGIGGAEEGRFGCARRLQVQRQRLPFGLLSDQGGQAPDGKFQPEIVQKVFENYADRYAKDCMPGN